MRRPAPFWAFALAFLVQFALLGWLVGDRAMLLARGTEIRLPVVPVDPRDFFRGDYVTLTYSLSRLDAGQLDGEDFFDRGDRVFVALRKDGDGWAPVSLNATPPPGAFGISGEVTEVDGGTGRCRENECLAYRIDYGLEKFFLPEGEGASLEKLRNDQKLSVDVAIGSGGRAAIKRLLIDGTPAYQEESF